MISPGDYSQIASAIDTYMSSLNKSIDHLDAVRTTLTGMVGDEQKKSALDYATETASGLTLTALVNNPKDILACISALQRHVTKYAGSVDAFLAGNNITVSATFADLSEAAGYPISVSNII